MNCQIVALVGCEENDEDDDDAIVENESMKVENETAMTETSYSLHHVHSDT